MSDVIDHQRVAADPAVSAFVTANAGSGKTKTLIDRVARLLLAGSEPEAILCVTYTKAAAAEMQRRLFDTLGGWSVLDDAALKGELSKLDGRDAALTGDAALSNARRLFARALETPGGLKIQTIHAFCEKLLRRFPLEAGVSPGFTVMDDAAAAVIVAAARADVAQAAQEPGLIGEAYARFSVALDFQAFQAMFAAFEARRDAIAAYVDRCGGLLGALADVRGVCGVDADDTVEAVTARTLAAVDRRLWLDCAEVLAGGGKNDAKCAGQLAAFAGDPAAGLEAALAGLFTSGGEGTPATWVAKTGGLKAREDLRARLLDQQDMLDMAREKLRAARVAEDTIHALVLADNYAKAYARQKAARGALDFADLVGRTQTLLTARADAAWVLFKLDGGIDHILLDEAQDTAPEQWDILRALTGEFFAGAGAPGWRRSDVERTLFVVGDEKQSIYSFQGAAPERLLEETRDYLALIEGAGRTARMAPLLNSYRSTQAVLTFVDRAFEPAPLAAALTPRPEGWAGDGDLIVHTLTRHGHPGCVDLWPLEEEIKGEDRTAWDAPLDQEAATSANRRLAERIAGEIEAIVARGDVVFDKETKAWRPAHFGDVLILVRRRRALFDDILRALKQRGVPVAGADRLALSAHIAFDDLMALARFVLFVPDDLTLAALLKSPLCGLDDDSLYALAKGREGGLWAMLNRREDERGEWKRAAMFLNWARLEAGQRRPFEFFARVLGYVDDGVSVRARLLTRLGGEAQDALDEFLNQVLAAEQRGVHDLETLVAAFAALDITVKREMEGARREVRVMTAHGSKGLEAPIVFLPETTLTRGAAGSPLLATPQGGFLWAASKKADCQASAQARAWREAKDEAEAVRLFYVALTRARDRLVVCGRIKAGGDAAKIGGWYGAVRDAFDHPAIAPQVRALDDGERVSRRYGPDPLTAAAKAEPAKLAASPPAWLRTPAPAEPASARWAAPSTLAEEEDVLPAPSPLDLAAGLGRYRRGAVIHRLLQLLPDVAADQRDQAAQKLLAAERDLTDAQRTEMAQAAFSVLNDPRFGDVFGPGSRPEVALAGQAADLPAGLAASGRMDRLLVADDRVLVVDFKTNRPAPARVQDAGRAYLTQMAVYVALLRQIYPGRRVAAAFVWTDGPKLMPVPEELIDQALADLRRDG